MTSVATAASVVDSIVGKFNKLVEWVKSEDGREAIETVAELPLEDNAIVETAGQLNDGLEKIDTAVEVVEDALRDLRGRAEALAARAGRGLAQVRPEGASTTRSCRSTLTPTEAVEETCDAVLDHARRVRDAGTAQPNRKPSAGSARWENWR